MGWTEGSSSAGAVGADQLGVCKADRQISAGKNRKIVYFIAIFQAPRKSARGLAHSKTLSRRNCALEIPTGFGVRQSSAAFSVGGSLPKVRLFSISIRA